MNIVIEKHAPPPPPSIATAPIVHPITLWRIVNQNNLISPLRKKYPPPTEPGYRPGCCICQVVAMIGMCRAMERSDTWPPYKLHSYGGEEDRWLYQLVTTLDTSLCHHFTHLYDYTLYLVHINTAQPRHHLLGVHQMSTHRQVHIPHSLMYKERVIF